MGVSRQLPIPDRVRAEWRARPELKGMGTTLTLAYVTGATLVIAHHTCRLDDPPVPPEDPVSWCETRRVRYG